MVPPVSKGASTNQDFIYSISFQHWHKTSNWMCPSQMQPTAESCGGSLHPAEKRDFMLYQSDHLCQYCDL